MFITNKRSKSCMNKQVIGITIAVLIGITIAVFMWHQQTSNDSNKSDNIVEKVPALSNTQNTTQVNTSTLPNNTAGKQYSIGLSESVTIKSP